MQLAILDWTVLIVYLVFIAAIGIIVGLKVKDSDHYFLGKRKFGKWLMMGQSFGIGTHAEMPVSLAGAVYSVGLSGIWYQWKNLFATPFYWMMAPVFRRIRRTTMAEMTEDRYGVWMGTVYTVFALSFFTINTASMLKGAGKVISQAAGGQIEVDQIVVAMTVIFIFYSFIGGLVATAWTDFFQSFLILVLSLMIVPLGWGAVGGLDGMKAVLDPHNFSLATPAGLGVWFIAMLTINGLIGIMAQPHMLAAVGTGKDERTCRTGMMYGNMVKRFCTVGWALVGLIVATLMVTGAFGVTQLDDPEDAFGFAARHLLFPGGLGLLIASVLAANMSTCSAFMVDSGALFTHNLYKKYARDRSDKHYLWVGRFSGLLITLIGVVYALLLVERVLYSFLLTETLATYMGISILGGILWRRANRWGSVSSLIVALATNFILYHRRGERLDHWEPDVFFAALTAGIAALVVVSLLTPPEPHKLTESFFGRLQTPSEGPVVSVDEWKQGQENPSIEPSRSVAEKGQQLIMVNLLRLKRASHGLGFHRAYRSDLVGFAKGWGWVLVLVFGTWLMFQF